MIYLITAGEMSFKIRCRVLEGVEDKVWIELPAVQGLINSPCLELVDRAKIFES